jgi:transposase-like protein
MGLTCPYCGSKDTIKRAWRKTKFGRKQRYLCKGCGRRFVQNDGFVRMVYPKEIIAEAISLYDRGLSFAKISEHFEEYKGIKPAPSTIWSWVQKYSKLLKDCTDKEKPEIKGPIHMDEVIVKVKGKKAYRWNAKDRKTRFKFSGNLTRKRSYDKGTKPLFKQIKQRCYDQFIRRKRMGKPILFVSDKLGHYKKGFNRYFSRIAELEFGVAIANEKHGREHNNNPIERDNEEVKERCSMMRGFKDLMAAKAILDLHDVVQNYVHATKIKGEKTARTPAERAGIRLNLGKQFRLLNLIALYFLSLALSLSKIVRCLEKFCHYCERSLQNGSTHDVCWSIHVI